MSGQLSDCVGLPAHLDSAQYVRLREVAKERGVWFPDLIAELLLAGLECQDQERAA